MPYERYVDEKIAKPLGMARTTFDPARGAQLGLAQGYVKRRGQVQPQRTRLTRGYNPTGMLLSDAEDAGRYLAALLGGGALDGARVLKPESVQRLWTPAADVSDGLGYGLGWFLRKDEGLRIVFHPGEILTMGSTFVLVPERTLGVAVLTNIDNDAKDEIAEGVTRLLLGFEPVLRTVPRPARPTPLCRAGASGIATSASTTRPRERCGSPATATAGRHDLGVRPGA